MLKDFKNFIMTGNVIEFAVAVILAGAVGLVVNGFVNDIIMPVVGEFAGGTDFAKFKIRVNRSFGRCRGSRSSCRKCHSLWGMEDTIVNLLIVGFVLFMIVTHTTKQKHHRRQRHHQDLHKNNFWPIYETS